MTILTVFTPAVHEKMIPHVRVEKLTRETFPFDYVNGETRSSMQQKIALNEKYANKQIFLLYEAEKNGTQRYFVREVSIELGDFYNGYYEVKSGLITSDRIVIETNKELFDGAEVFIE